MKSKWLEIIGKHQNVESSGFIMCENHFDDNNYTQKRTSTGGRLLKKEAIPSIFPTHGTSHEFPNNPIPRIKLSPKKFCGIKFCRNECGTNIKQILFFKVPKEGVMRKQWIESISKHQEFDFYNLNFIICELHFLSEDFTNKSGARILKQNAIPTFFENSLCYDYDSPVFSR